MEDQFVAVITGAYRGLGYETCRQLAAQGYRVILTARKEDAGHAAVKALQSQGLDAVFHYLEVTDEETRDILTRIYLVSTQYFNELVSLMLREEDLKTRTAEEAFERIHEQVGDMTSFTEEAE